MSTPDKAKRPGAGLGEIQRLDARILLKQFAPTSHNRAIDMLFEIRNEVVFRSERTAPTTWQDAWNTATGSKPNLPGLLSFHVVTTCTKCNGRRFDPHSARPCHECFGRGRSNQQVRLVTMYAEVPADA